MSTPTIEQRCDAQEWVHRYSGHSHLLTADELRRVLVENEELKRKVENQRERIVYLEGATSHACGTPLSIMRSQRDQWRECARLYNDSKRGPMEGDVRYAQLVAAETFSATITGSNERKGSEMPAEETAARHPENTSQ